MGNTIIRAWGPNMGAKERLRIGIIPDVASESRSIQRGRVTETYLGTGPYLTESTYLRRRRCIDQELVTTAACQGTQRLTLAGVAMKAKERRRIGITPDLAMESGSTWSGRATKTYLTGLYVTSTCPRRRERIGEELATTAT